MEQLPAFTQGLELQGSWTEPGHGDYFTYMVSWWDQTCDHLLLYVFQNSSCREKHMIQ